ncbi:MAG: BatD family protein [Planctomycetes bacterium]|nr:BatD family protein [Planctomycetota bacterium]
MKNLSWIWVCLSLWLLSGAAAAQGEPARVSAHLSTGVAKLGAPVEIIVVIEGTLDGRIGKVPAVDGLQIGEPQGPSTERSMRSVGGSFSVELRATWRIPIAPERTGDFQIPPFQITVGQDVFETQAMPLRVREDLAGAALGHMDFQVSPERIVVGQPFDVTLTFGWDAGLAARINHADLSLPWLGELAGAIEIEDGRTSIGGRQVTISLNGEGQIEVDSLGRQTLAGRDLVVYRLKRSYLATTAGAIAFPVSHLEFGRVSGGSIFDRPRAIETYYKSAAARSVTVAALPEAGRPIEFGGAVGQITAWAEADRREVELGDSIKLTVTWSGDGNLEFFDLPDLDLAPGFKGLRLFGVTEKVKTRNARVSVFDLAPVEPGIEEIPPVPLVVFDPVLGRYLTVETLPIPIRVHALEGQGGLEELGALVPRDDIRDLITTGFRGTAATPEAGARFARPGQALFAAGGLLFLGFLFLRPRLRAGLDPAAPRERRRRRAKRRFGRDLRRAHDPSARYAALCEFLAARTRTEANAWYGQRSDLVGPESLAATLAARLDRALEALEQTAWSPPRGDASGGPTSAPTDEELRDLGHDLIQGGL